MGLGDIVHDSIYSLLDEISEYDYFLDGYDEICEVISVHLKAVAKLDMLGSDGSNRINRIYEINEYDWLSSAKNIVKIWCMENKSELWEEYEKSKNVASNLPVLEFKQLLLKIKNIADENPKFKNDENASITCLVVYCDTKNNIVYFRNNGLTREHGYEMNLTCLKPKIEECHICYNSDKEVYYLCDNCLNSVCGDCYQLIYDKCPYCRKYETHTIRLFNLETDLICMEQHTLNEEVYWIEEFNSVLDELEFLFDRESEYPGIMRL